jgi:hypothetical protein
VAGILGPLLAGVFKDSAAEGGSPIAWMTPFIIAGVACLLGALLMLFTRAPGERTRTRIGGPARTGAAG